MADRDDELGHIDDPALAVAARHALHDEELVAAFSVDGDDCDDPDRARRFIERCSACRDLHADLVGIHGALQATGKAEAVAARQRAPRDYRLSIETANRLRPGSVVLRLRDRVANAFSSFGRPMGMSMAALGVVGLLLGTITLGGGAAFGPAVDEATMLSSGAPAASAPIPGTGELNGVESPTFRSDRSIAPLATDMTPSSDGGEGPGAATGVAVGSIAIIGASVALLVSGFVLFALGSRRREPVPGG